MKPICGVRVRVDGCIGVRWRCGWPVVTGEREVEGRMVNKLGCNGEGKVRVQTRGRGRGYWQKQGVVITGAR